MPADRPNIGTGRRRQSETTDPDRTDDSRKLLEKEIAEETAHEDTPRARTPGANSPEGPHREIKPGTRRDMDEADPGAERDD